MVLGGLGRASQDRHYGVVREKTVHFAKNTHKGRSGVAKRTLEVLRAGGVRREALVEDGVLSVSMLGGCQCNVKESIDKTHRSKKPRMLRPLRLSSISLSSSSPWKASAFGESGILVRGAATSRSESDKAQAVVVVHTRESGDRQNSRGRDYIGRGRKDVVRKENEIQTPIPYLSLSYPQHRLPRAIIIRTVLARPEGTHLATGISG